MTNIFKSILLVLVVMIIGGCSGNSSNPVTPFTEESIGQDVTEVPIGSHQVWSSGTIIIDPETMTAEVVPDRDSSGHFEVGGMVQVDVNLLSIDTVEWIADVDVAITNTTAMAGFDVRMIIMASSAGHRLLNADDWTKLFDEPDGMPINPFKAYAKDQPTREFLPAMVYTENMLISVPGGNFNVRYAVDASYPANCNEPYEINGFMAADLWDSLGAEALVEVDVLSWNDDVEAVELYLPAVTGEALVEFDLDAGNHWTLDLANMVPAPIGEYVGYIQATTTSGGALALYDEVVINVVEDTSPEYVGSNRCSGCHRGTHNKWVESGHPFATVKTDGVEPVYPFTGIPSAPPGFTWGDVSYAVGGYGWGGVFINDMGYELTGLEGAFIFEDMAWHPWHEEDPPGTEPFDRCGRCHTTNWIGTGENGPFQDGLPGIHGVFSEPGVSCESCHGPAGDHVSAPSSSNISVDGSNELCGECHSSGDDDQVRSRDGLLITGHSQYNEIVNGPKPFFTCNTCHDVHSSTIYDDQAMGDGVSACTDCHEAATHTVAGGMAHLECIDCHMPEATAPHYAGNKTGEGVHYKGNMRSHVFQIDTSGVTLEDYFTEVNGRTVIDRIDGEIKLNLAYACMQCHDGNQAFNIDNYALAAERATGMHNPEPNHFVGRAVCAGCHDGIEMEYQTQTHALDFLVAHDRDLIYGYGGGCAPCHTIGFDEPTGFLLDGTTTHLEGIGCEECHGMGSEHIDFPTTSNITRMPAAESTCWECHSTGYKNMETPPLAVTDEDLYEDAPGSVGPHHPMIEVLSGTLGYNRDGEPGTHFGINNTCVSCHMTQDGAIDHTAAVFGVDFESCAGCHGSAGNAEALYEAMEHETTASLIEIGGEDPLDPGHPDHDAAGGLLGDFATLHGIDLENNADPDNPLVQAYKGARHNFLLIVTDASYGNHNPGYTRRLLNDAKELLGEFTPPHFVGRTVCGSCHMGIEMEYQTQTHALDFLVAHDRDLIYGYGGGCAPCHTIGFDEPTGFLLDGTTPHLEGIGCEECHGMGSEHILAPSSANITRMPAAESTCWECHATSYKVMETNPVAVTAEDLREDAPGDVGVHHPMVEFLHGTLGYERDGERGIHSYIGNTCVTCHMTQDGMIDHTADVYNVDFESCAGCHGSAGNAEAMFHALEAEILAELILIGGEDPADPGHPDHDAMGGLLGDFAMQHGIDLENNVDPDNPLVQAYKGARHNYILIVTDASWGMHNHGYARNLLNDAKTLLGH